MIRVYYLPNSDGVNSNLVAATNLREARRIMNATRGDYANYGGRRIDPGNDPESFVETAMRQPGTVFYRRIDPPFGVPNPWRREPYR